MSSAKPVIILGAGGHASAVADALLAAGRQVLGFTDPNPARHGQLLCGCPVLGDDDVLKSWDREAVELGNGLGGVGRAEDLPRRRRMQELLVADGWRFADVRHPTASVSVFALIEPTVQLLAGSRIQPGAIVGEGCIVGTSVIVEHGAYVEPWGHLASGAILCGDVRVGVESHVGAGAVVRQGVRLGAQTVVGAGAVVVEDFAGQGLIVGVPARHKDRRT